MSTDQILQAQAQVQDDFMTRQNVVGVAVGYKQDKTADNGEPALVVLVEQKKPLAALSAGDIIPPTVDGIRTDVYEVGYLRAFQSPRERFRPVIPSGVSIGHYKITAGTLGTIVTDRQTGARLILSNNHVIANSNDAQIGDPILQPGPTDGGTNPGDVVARLERFVGIRFIGDTPGPLPPTPDPGPNPGGCLLIMANLINFLGGLIGTSNRLVMVETHDNEPAAPTPTKERLDTQAVGNLVDAALGRPLDDAMFSGEILNIGTVSGTKPAALGQRVRKMGRTTAYTEGTVTLLNATVTVAYGSRSARFTNQVIATAMSQGGDSGSLIVDAAEPRAVGLLFAGSPQATIFNPIQAVLDALNITI